MLQPSRGSNIPAGRPRSIPAPVKGWNAADSIADMGQMDAIFLDNFFPRTGDVMLRKGYKEAAALPAGKEVRALIGYKSPAAAAKLFAAAQDGIYDITAGNATVPVSAATDARWQHVNVTTAGGSFLWMANEGADKCKLYNGTTWTDLDDLSSPALTGVTSASVVNVATFKTRIILCVKDSLSFWYLPNNAIAGAAVEFPLGALFTKGGYLMATATWTVDGGNGPDDYFVAITSEGEVAVYSGTDPSSSSTFALVGIFQLAAPMSRRCFQKLASDTLVLTKAAIYPLSKSLGAKDIDPSAAVTHRIQRAYSDFAQEFGAQYGWQPALFPEASMLLINVPMGSYPLRNIAYSYQFVMNTMTGAWCRFTNQHAECLLAFDGKLYFALHNRIFQAWTGTDDAGQAIQASAKTAFSPLGSGRIKHVKMVRPLLQSETSISVRMGVDTDYSDNTLAASQTSYVQSLTKWDEAVWGQSRWNGSSLILSKWQSINCRPGRTAAIRLRVAAKGVTLSWIATDLIVVDGGMM